MKNNTKINKYVNLTLISNFIFLDNFAGCKKGGKGNNNKGYSGKGNKSTETNTTPNEEQHKEETPDNPKGNKPPTTKDYTKEKNEFKLKLNEIDTKNKFLPDKRITLDKPTLEDKINKIKSDEQVNDINIELRRLESQLTNALTNLKQDYIIRLKEIINGNNKLNLGLDINLTENTINSLDFDKNISDRKTDLENLETKYTESLKNKCENLKTKYNKLVVDKDKIEEKEQKDAANSLCNLTNNDFDNIKKYETYEELNKKITQIESIIKKDVDKLKEDFTNDYKNYKTIATNLGLTITSLNVDLLKKIEKLSMASIKDVKSTLDNINKIIENGINNLNNKFEKEYKEIKGKIEHLKNNDIEFDYTEINTNITKDTNLENLQKSINNLKTKLTTTIEDLKTKYNNEIKDLNKKLNDLSITEQISSDILDELTYDKLNDKTISNIENTINNANKKCNKKIEELKNECKSKLDEAKKTNEDILKNKGISTLINDINDAINNIKTTENKNYVDTLLEKLTTKIEEENKKAEEEKKKEEEEKKKKKEEEEKKKRQGIIENFKDGYKIDDAYNLKIKLEGNKFKLYFNETTFIAESEKVNETTIKDINDYKNYRYTTILKFRGRKEFIISEQKIDDIINNFVKLVGSLIKGYYEETKHFFLNLNITFNNKPYNDIYDFNRGNLIHIGRGAGKERVLCGRSVDTNKDLFLAGLEVGYNLIDNESCKFIPNKDGKGNYNKIGTFEEVADKIEKEDFELMTEVKLANN